MKEKTASSFLREVASRYCSGVRPGHYVSLLCLRCRSCNISVTLSHNGITALQRLNALRVACAILARQQDSSTSVVFSL